jgi:hypothetical protein
LDTFKDNYNNVVIYLPESRGHLYLVKGRYRPRSFGEIVPGQMTETGPEKTHDGCCLTVETQPHRSQVCRSSPGSSATRCRSSENYNDGDDDSAGKTPVVVIRVHRSCQDEEEKAKSDRTGPKQNDRCSGHLYQINRNDPQ